MYARGAGYRGQAVSQTPSLQPIGLCARGIEHLLLQEGCLLLLQILVLKRNPMGSTHTTTYCSRLPLIYR